MDLISAAKNGNFELTFNLLQSGYQTTICDKDNATPLYWSACHGHASICEILIQAGSDVDTRVTWGSTPLHAAADRGHKSCIEVLLDSGAQVNARNSRGDTALHIAAYRGHVDIIRTLLRHNADVTIKNDKGKTPQQEALEGGHRKIAENIINAANVATLQNSRSPSPIRHNNVNTPPRSPEVRRNGHAQTTPRSPEIRRNISVRQPSEFCDENYEQNTHPRANLASHHVLQKQTSIEPPPRPPSALCRSISFSGNHCRHGNLRAIPGRLVDTEYRTNSLGSIPGYNVMNDLNSVNTTRFPSLDSVSVRQLFGPQCDSLSQCSSYLTESSAYSSDTSWNNTSSLMPGVERESQAMESTDYSAAPMTSDQAPRVPPRLAVVKNTPFRTPSSSVRQALPQENRILNGHSDDPLVFRKELIDSYQNVETLTSENAKLKFKCTTLLGRLSELERLYNEKQMEIAELKQTIEKKTSQVSDLENKLNKTEANSALNTLSMDSHGFKRFCEKMNKELSEQTIEDMQGVLRASLETHTMCSSDTEVATIDAPHREWVPGVDYVILGTQPISEVPNCSHDNSATKSLTFSIKHLKTGRKLRLKMLLRRRKCSLLQTDSEVDVIEKIGRHANIVNILHSYEGSIERFKRFIPVSLLGADSLDDLSCRTTFLVTEQLIPLTSYVRSLPSARGLISVFLTHALYQLLSLLCVLEELHITHNNINEHCIFIDSECKPVLSNFEQAMCLSEKEVVKLNEGNFSTASETSADENLDYENVIHIARGSQPQSETSTTASASRVQRTDLQNLCKVFNDILLSEPIDPSENTSTKRNSDDTLSENTLCIPMDIWRNMNGILANSRHISCRELLKRAGLSLYGPKSGLVKTEFECRVHVMSRMFHLLSFEPQDQRQTLDYTSDVRRAMNSSSYHSEAHFLCNTTSRELWDMLKSCCL